MIQPWLTIHIIRTVENHLSVLQRTVQRKDETAVIHEILMPPAATFFVSRHTNPEARMDGIVVLLINDATVEPLRDVVVTYKLAASVGYAPVTYPEIKLGIYRRRTCCRNPQWQTHHATER